MLPTLPVSSSLPALCQALAVHPAAVLEAPPGAGKTTLVPLALLNEPWLAGKSILMLEPRRLAARMSARRMASLLAEAVGQTVGYRVRQEAKVSRQTRLEIITEGILTRRLHGDPELAGVGLVIFDEFHERSLQADLGLALCLEVQQALRDDLRLLVMSATLDGAAVAGLLGAATPVIRSEGRAFPVETRFLPPRPKERPEQAMAAAVREALRQGSGSILAFLPGEGEIRRTLAALEGSALPADVDLAPLYGALSPQEQDRAVRPAAAGRRKVVLATSIAETSLTIEGIAVVVDGGQARRSRFDPGLGMSRLVTTRVSRAEADQRRGRAGRLGPGLCYRLWSEAEDRALAPYPPPEIREADLAPLALDLAAWGAAAEDLAWLDPPPAAGLAQARALLADLGALEDSGRLTPHGAAMAALPLHPRLAHMILCARQRSPALGALACEVAALLEERDPLRGSRSADLRARLEALHGTGGGGSLSRIRQTAREWQKRLGLGAAPLASVEQGGVCVALAYPDRLGQRRGGGYRLSGGRGAVLDADDALNAQDWLAVADVDGGAANARIHLAAPLTLAEIEDLYGADIVEADTIAWDTRSESVVARRQRRLKALVLKEDPLPKPDPARLAEGLVDGIRQTGLHILPWDKASTQFCARVTFLRRAEGPQGLCPSGESDWPDVSDPALLESLEDWLLPYLSGLKSLAQVKKVPLLEALKARLPWPLHQRLEAEAPTHFEVPTGSRIPLDYTGEGTAPVLAVRIQELFGCTTHPAIAGGKVPLVVHLLSPAQRPLQITQDVPGFWKTSYPQVQAEMKGRYPRHPWPDDPTTAPPTRRVKPRA